MTDTKKFENMAVEPETKRLVEKHAKERGGLPIVRAADELIRIGYEVFKSGKSINELLKEYEA